MFKFGFTCSLLFIVPLIINMDTYKCLSFEIYLNATVMIIGCYLLSHSYEDLSVYNFFV